LYSLGFSISLLLYFWMDGRLTPVEFLASLVAAPFIVGCLLVEVPALLIAGIIAVVLDTGESVFEWLRKHFWRRKP
jgi:hypothetical protein